jgi:hypothetical protein
MWASRGRRDLPSLDAKPFHPVTHGPERNPQQLGGGGAVVAAYHASLYPQELSVWVAEGAEAVHYRDKNNVSVSTQKFNSRTAACVPHEARREWASGDGSVAWINGRLE